MRSWIIELLVMCLVAGGFFLSAGSAGDNRAIDGQGNGFLQTTESSNMLPNTIESLPKAPSTNEETALPADEKVSVAALTCTIKDSGDYVVDLRYKNPGIENRTIIIIPSGVKLDMLPNTTYRYYLQLTEEVSILNISVDDGTELQVSSPNCTTQGGSGSGSYGFAGQEQKPLQPTPPPPVPELSPLVLTLAGISGLLLLSRTRKN